MDERELIIQGEQQLAAAHLTLDLALFEHLLHPDYLILQPNGRVESRADVLASYRSGEREWFTAEVDQLEVRLVEKTALVNGRWRATGRNKDAHFNYAARFLSVWVKAAGRWQNVAYQGVEIGR